MFDYAFYNSGIYTKRFQNYNSGVIEREREGEREGKIQSYQHEGGRQIDLRILTSQESLI